jgi:hypothetical protein
VTVIQNFHRKYAYARPFAITLHTVGGLLSSTPPGEESAQRLAVGITRETTDESLHEYARYISGWLYSTHEVLRDLKHLRAHCY